MAAPVQKFVTDGFSQQVAGMLEERVARLNAYVSQDKPIARTELKKFVWSTGRDVRKAINPDTRDAKRIEAWQAAKGVLKTIINFEKFSALSFAEDSVQDVLEKKCLEVMRRYKHYVETGELETRWTPPKLLGETDEIFCVDKPCLWTCSYGDRDGSIPRRQGAQSASGLLNGEKPEIQIHEYLALKYKYENANETRKWWAEMPEGLPCKKKMVNGVPGACGECPDCAKTQSGCCNRLDQETSGVMVVAKTQEGFKEIRGQFASEHSLEKGGTEKYYLCLVHGKVTLPSEPDERGEDWKHTQVDGRGRVEVACYWNKHRSVAWDDPKKKAEEGTSKEDDDAAKLWRKQNNQGRQYALTFYEPIAWFSSKDTKKKHEYTLTHVQIVTGRRHQIRFHLAEAGYPLVGDTNYGAPPVDRHWAKRIFLHSYQTKFREPFSYRWFECISPLSEDLGNILCTLKLDRVKEGMDEKMLFLSRRKHDPLKQFMKQYDPAKPLLYSHDAPVNAEAILAVKVAKGLITMPAGVQAATAALPTSNGAASWQEAAPSGSEASKGSTWNSDGWDKSAWNQSSWDKNEWSDSGWKDTDKTGKDSWQDNSWQDVATSKKESEAKQAAPVKKESEAKQAAPVKKESEAKQAAPVKQVVKLKPFDDDDDDWGDWSRKDKPATKNTEAQASSGKTQQAPVPAAEPPAKRPRIDAPPQQAAQVLTAPPGAAPRTPPSVLPQALPPVNPWRRMESRSQAGIFYYWNPSTGQTSPEPPPPWELKQSRSQPGVSYYWNSQTGVTSVVKPEI